ncbi:MAG TPA: hypothetical protein VI958_06860, partial [Acidobacteriota bacterium]
ARKQVRESWSGNTAFALGQKQGTPSVYVLHGYRLPQAQGAAILVRLLHVLDVLSHFKWARKDKRFKEMLNIVESKADEEGRFVPESIWTAWKDWDFGQKKIASQGLTLFVQRILKRVN